MIRRSKEFTLQDPTGAEWAEIVETNTKTAVEIRGVLGTHPHRPQQSGRTELFQHVSKET